MIDRSLRDRYSRQTILAEIGDEGQAKLLASRAVVIGCGALGCIIADLLTRAGVGDIRIIDRDFIEYHNLQRQLIFTEEDIKDELPKAIAAERYLKKVNSTIKIKGIVADVNYSNIESLCSGADIILDGLDNASTRMLINDYSQKYKIPWVYGGALATHGMTMNIIPGKSPCLRCIRRGEDFDDRTMTCETVGVVNTIPVIVGSLEVTEAIKILTGSPDVNVDLISFDIWRNRFDRLKVDRYPQCPACNGRYEFLEKPFKRKLTSLCGQTRAVQIIDTGIIKADLKAISKKTQKFRNVRLSDYFLRFDIDDRQIIIFPDGRTIIKNTIDENEADSIFTEQVVPLVKN